MTMPIPNTKATSSLGLPLPKPTLPNRGRRAAGAGGLLCCVLLFFQPLTSLTQEQAMPATSSKTAAYRIVISRNAQEGEKMAGAELAAIMRQAAGHDFPVVTDAEPETAREIVLGETTRLPRAALPADLQPVEADGFAVIRQDQKLFVIGRTARGTLYGTYDVLEQDFGCRFLAPEVTHVPQQEFSVARIASRKYDPPLEYRVIWGMRYRTPWNIRNRVDSVQSEPAIGQARFVGPRPHHTFGYLVPAEEHFATHPEYYALVNGERRRTDGGKSGGLCLSHPEVLPIAIKSVRQWIDDYRHSRNFHPDSLQLVSVSVNDEAATMVCQCPDCQAANAEEGAPSGTLIRFVNAIARDLENDYPNVRLETLAYSRVDVPPARTQAHPHVIIRMAPIGADFFRPLDDPASAVNQPFEAGLKQWSERTGNLYVWSYHINFHALFKPYPDFHTIAKNIRFLRRLGLRGYFAETSSDGGVLHELRAYVLAKCLWRPETNSSDAIEEFCRLYYGKGGGGVLRFISMIHDYVAATGLPLHWNDASRADGIVYDYDFILAAEAALAAAEDAAETEAEKQRVAEVRLSTWYLLLEKAFVGGIPYAGSIPLPVDWAFRLDPDNSGFARQWHREKDVSNWQRVRTDDFWTRQGYEFHGTAWYATGFAIPADAAGAIDAIDFGAIDGEFHRVYLDGIPVQERTSKAGEAWNEPFRVILPAPLPAGQHMLTVEVRKLSHAAGIWKPVTLVNRSVRLPETVRAAAERFIAVSTRAEIKSVAPGVQADEYRRRIQALLLTASSTAEPPPGAAAIHQKAALLPNPHQTYSLQFDATSSAGSCLFQTADRDWTLGQSMRWPGLDEHIRAARDRGLTAFLRVLVRVQRTTPVGPAFQFGYARQNVHNWGATMVGSRPVMAADTPADSGWLWYELPEPLTLQPQPARQYFAFVLPANNPENVAGVSVEAFELVFKPAAD